MDTSFNFIRPPDEAKMECIMEEHKSEYDKQMEEALYLSMQDLQEINRKYEEELLNEHVKITNERKELFKGILFDIHKLVRFDKEIKEIYEIIEPIIDAYCEQYIKEYEIDSLTYDRIFTIISHIRTNKKNIELLKSIFVKN